MGFGTCEEVSGKALSRSSRPRSPDSNPLLFGHLPYTFRECDALFSISPLDAVQVYSPALSTVTFSTMSVFDSSREFQSFFFWGFPCVTEVWFEGDGAEKSLFLSHFVTEDQIHIFERRTSEMLRAEEAD